MYPDASDLLLRFIETADGRDMQHVLQSVMAKSDAEIPWHHLPVLTCDLAEILALAAHRTQAMRRTLKLLTARESEIMLLIGAGLSNQEACSELGIAERTVRQHLENMQVKLGVSGRGKLVALAFGLGPICGVSA